jgi:hypothetical protein
MIKTSTLESFLNPPRAFSLFPFWFWNDELKLEEILRQIEDFEAHGVFGFVIHPRMGLPKSLVWMSDNMLDFVEFAVFEAAKRKMRVILYDEGMYPSGSACGQVVAANPSHAARCIDKVLVKNREDFQLPSGWNLLTFARGPEGDFAVVEKPSGGVIRGIHYVDDAETQEDLPPAADILNPEAVQSFIGLVHERFAKRLKKYFGSTILGIFTDEPNPVGRDVKGLPGTRDILSHVKRILGYDFLPHLASLWYDATPESKRYREDYHRAVSRRLEETFNSR